MKGGLGDTPVETALDFSSMINKPTLSMKAGQESESFEQCGCQDIFSGSV